MGARIGVGLLGLGTVGGGVASILLSPRDRHPLVAELELVRVAVALAAITTEMLATCGGDPPA